MAVYLGVVPILLAAVEAFVVPSMSAYLRRGKAKASKQHGRSSI